LRLFSRMKSDAPQQVGKPVIELLVDRHLMTSLL
jgi:hypothetical protein